MKIRKCGLDDLPGVLSIYSEAREFMRASGNPSQWVNGYPDRELVVSDIEQGKLYTVVRGEELLAVFYFSTGDDPTYEKIYNGSWKNDKPYGVIHRIAVAESAHGMGLSRICFDYCYERCGNLKIDTHRDNIPMQKALLKAGFEYCGIIYLPSADERIAFQKV